MKKEEAKAEIARLRKSGSSKYGSHKLVKVGDEWGVQFTPRRKRIYK